MKCFVKIIILLRNFMDEEQEECTSYTIAAILPVMERRFSIGMI
jgi:hypothetical protein